MAKGAVVARIISEYSDKGSRAAQKDIKKLGADYDSFAHKAKFAFGVAAAASAAFAVKVGIDSVKAAMADQQSQALLAKSLQNTTGANKDAIAAVEKYINTQQLALGVQDDQLRPSLATLATATHDVTKAQELQSLALDLAAGRNKDLQATSVALAKAYAGNFNALKRMGVPLSENLIKSKNFAGIVAELSKAVGGSASVAANTFAGRLERMKLGFKEAQESLGYALMPALTGFINTLVTDVLPKVQAWIDANKDKLANSLQTVTSFISDMTKKAVAFGEWVTNNMGIVKAFGVILATIWGTAKIIAFVKVLGTITTAFKAIRTAAAGAAIVEAIATGGLSLGAGAIAAATAAALIGTTLVGVNLLLDENAKKTQKVTESTVQSMGSEKAAAVAASQARTRELQSKKTLFGLDAAKTKAEIAAARQAQIDAAKKAKQLADEIKSQKELALLKGLGVTPTSATDPIELEAVRLNLLKQQNLEAQAGYDRLVAQYEAMMSNNTAAQRYADILNVIADKNISTAEVDLLAKKWGMSKDQVVLYIGKIFEVPALMDPTEAARIGFAKSLDLLDQVIAKIKVVNTTPVSPGSGVTPTMVANGTGYVSSAGLSSADLNAGTFSQYYQGLSGGLYGSTPVNPSVVSPSYDPLSGMIASASTASFGVNNASTMSGSGASASAGGTSVYLVVDGQTIASAVVPAVTQGILQNQISGKNITYSGFAV